MTMKDAQAFRMPHAADDPMIKIKWGYPSAVFVQESATSCRSLHRAGSRSVLYAFRSRFEHSMRNYRMRPYKGCKSQIEAVSAMP